MSRTRTLRLGVLAAGATLLVPTWNEAAGPAESPRAPARPRVASPGRLDALDTPPAGALRRAPLLFVENVGQSELPGTYVAAVSGGSAAFGPDGFFLQFVEPTAINEARHPGLTDVAAHSVAGLNLRFTFEGASPVARIAGEERLPTHVNVYNGSDPSQWHEDIPAFAAVRCTDVYPGIDVLFHDMGGVLEYDLLVEPGGDPSGVVLRCEGADGITLEADGKLALSTALGTWRMPPPETYVVLHGERRLVACRYRSIDRERFGFEVEGWDRSASLVIDPGLVYASYLGGTGPAEAAVAVAADASGCAFVGGNGGGSGFPTTPGAFLTTSPAGSAYVTKFSADGSALVYSTYLAKVSGTVGLAITAAGEAIALCRTSNLSFPTTAGAWDTTFNGTKDFYETAVAKLGADGGHLVFSTFVGGSGDDSPADIALGPDGTVYAAGTTTSPDFPTTPGAYWESGTGKNVFVTRLAADGSSLVYSTLLGAAINWEEAFGLAVAPDGSAIVVGRAFGLEPGDFPVTPGAYDTTLSGGHDAFVARLDDSGSRLLFATYLGGMSVDEAYDVCLAPDGSLYVVGRTDSFDFPTSPGAKQSFLWSSNDGFISHLSADGTSLLHSTYLGHGSLEKIYAVGVDPDGHVVIADDIDNPQYITPDAASPSFGSAIHKLDAMLSTILYGSDIGAGVIFDMSLDPNGTAYIVGQTSSPTFATPGAFDTTLGGSIDAFVVKFDFSPWTDLGLGLAGTGGLVPLLSGVGTLQPGSAGSLTLTQARPLAPVTLVIGLTAIHVPFKGGTLLPAPLLLLALFTDGAGSAALPWSAWPAGLPAGTDVVLQAWISDPLAPKGLAASNGLSAVTPVPFIGS